MAFVMCGVRKAQKSSSALVEGASAVDTLNPFDPPNIDNVQRLCSADQAMAAQLAKVGALSRCSIVAEPGERPAVAEPRGRSLARHVDLLLLTLCYDAHRDSILYVGNTYAYVHHGCCAEVLSHRRDVRAVLY